MTHDEKLRAYKAFFIDSDAGKDFMTEMSRLIDDAHQAAENRPELARDYVQRAKGLRQVLDHIRDVGLEIKKGARVKD